MPRVRGRDRTDAPDERLVSLLAPHSYGAEQYRVLRHLVEQTHAATGLSILAVSSADVADGKTTTAINLAGTLAQAFAVRVLLVDADLRRPQVAARLGLAADAPGLVNAILDPELDLPAVAQPFAGSRLAVVTAGRFSGAPHEVLHSPRLGELLTAARTSYDYVVVDTPPLVPSPDARVISKWVDGVLLVVCAHKTPRKLVEESLNLLSREKTVGLVFNNDTRPLARNHGYYAPDPAPSGAEGPGRWTRLRQKVATALGVRGDTSWR